MRNPKIIEQDGLAFKDLSGSGELLPYEDWRLTPDERAKDLAGRLSIEEIAGLMLYSPHQMVPFRPGMPFVGHYDGKVFEDGVTDPSAVSDEQKELICKEHIRSVLIMLTESAETTAKWNNNMQAMAEQEPWGIPVSFSSDPRHAASGKNAEFASGGKDVSRWPEGLGMAALFSPERVKEFAQVVSKEYRALGITMALGPQIDLATEPRWMRYEDTMGGNRELLTKLVRAYCDGLQTTEDAPNGWGRDSVAAMVKHWPGGGTGEAGRDAHYPYGKYAVFPGGELENHMKVFTEGAFALDGPTRRAAAVMPYYTISWNQDTKNGENVGNSYSEYLIKNRLREDCQYDGIVCTDWGITGEPSPEIDSFKNRPHGMEHVSEEEQHLRIIMNGVDQFGGNDSKDPIIKAYEIGCERFGQEAMRARMEESARRILKAAFTMGLFENAYLDPKESAATVGAPEFVEAGLAAQRDSVVLLKNKEQVLPLQKGIKLYVPKRHLKAHKAFFRTPVPGEEIVPLTPEFAADWFTLVEDPAEADAAVVFVESPRCDGGYTKEEREATGNGYMPISLQYRPYTATEARKVSIAGGDPREESTNRSYYGKTGTVYNEEDLDLILDTKTAMGDKPVIVSIQLHNPAVMSEFEGSADAILADFGVEKKVILDILTGAGKPGGHLPVILPKDMATIEHHKEDVFDDIEAYTDSEGNTYGFGFGLSY
jgi:beta-glucosidase